MASTDSFALLITRLRTEEDVAAREIFHRFAGQLIALARRRFDALMRAKVDVEDVVQSAYKSFFIRFREGKLDPYSWNSLWGLLTLIVLRKCADRVEYYRAERRDARREVSAPAASDSGPALVLIDREPSPLEAAMLTEAVEDLLRSTKEDERPIIELSMQGFSALEISQQLNRAERTVRRVRERVKKRLERLHLEES